MSFRACMVLSIVSAGLVMGSLRLGTDSSKATSGFVSGCRTVSGDREFGEGITLVLVHEIGQGSTVLFKVDGAEVEPLGDLHHETRDHAEFLEAQGGVESTAIASDVVAFLRRAPFALVGDWRVALSSGEEFPRCNVIYTETERYRASCPVPPTEKAQ